MTARDFRNVPALTVMPGYMLMTETVPGCFSAIIGNEQATIRQVEKGSFVKTRAVRHDPNPRRGLWVVVPIKPRTAQPINLLKCGDARHDKFPLFQNI